MTSNPWSQWPFLLIESELIIWLSPPWWTSLFSGLSWDSETRFLLCRLVPWFTLSIGAPEGDSGAGRRGWRRDALLPVCILFLWVSHNNAFYQGKGIPFRGCSWLQFVVFPTPSNSFMGPPQTPVPDFRDLGPRPTRPFSGPEKKTHATSLLKKIMVYTFLPQ